MNLRTLMSTYRTDPVSNFAKLEYCTRRYYVRLMAQIERDHGDVDVATIKGRTIYEWHQAWTDGGKKISMGHALVGMLRTLANFGFFALDDEACQRLGLLLSKGRFANGKPRTVHITREQATTPKRLRGALVGKLYDRVKSSMPSLNVRVSKRARRSRSWP